MDTQVGNPNASYLLALAAVVVGLTIWSVLANARARRRFAQNEIAQRLLPKTAKPWISTLLHCLTVTLLVLGLMDIRWGKSEREVQQKGYEIMFAVDVSRSMLAADASPNRLERAKQQIIAMLDEMDNDRIGLVAFAGSANQVVPLTRQYDEFIASLSELTPDSVDLGGSQLSLALETAAKGFLKKTGSYRTIVLFSDGEDQDSSPANVARQLRESTGARVFTIGLGDEQRGARIPNHRSRFRDFVRYQGEVVYTKLESEVLKEIANESGGVYIPAGTQRVNMSDFYHRFIASEEKTNFESATFSAYTPRYHWFLIPALCALCLDLWLKTPPPKTLQTTAGNVLAKLLLIGFVLLPLAPNTAYAQEPEGEPKTADNVEQTINLANAMIGEDDPKQAIELLNSLSGPEYRDQRNYNLGVAHFRNQEYENAAAQFQQTAKSKITDIASRSRFNLGNCFYQQALKDIGTSPTSSAPDAPTVAADPNTAIELLRQAITQYRSTLRLDPENMDARRNIELAYRLLKQQEQEQQEQQQQQQQQEQQEQQESQENQENQENQESDDPGESGDQQDANQEQSQSESDPNQEQQQDSDRQQDQQQNSGQPQNGSQEEMQGSSSSNEPRDDERQANQNEQGGDPSEDSDEAQDPASNSAGQDFEQDGQADPKPIDGELTSNESKDPDEPNQEGARQPQDGRAEQVNSNAMTYEEAMKMLQAIRDRKLRRKFQLRERERRRRLLDRPLEDSRVEKDW